MVTLRFREEHGDNRIHRLPNGTECAMCSLVIFTYSARVLAFYTITSSARRAQSDHWCTAVTQELD